MELSIFLAKVLGFYFIFIALFALLRKEQFRSFVEGFIASETLIAYSGIISLLFGLAIVIGHPIWEWNWRGLITFIGVIAIIKGILRTGFAKELQGRYSTFTYRKLYWLIVISAVVLGSFLIYSGFNPQ